MYEANDVAVFKKANIPIPIDGGLLPTWRDEPVVVGVFVVVARDLLLIGSDRICLDVRVQEATSPAHVLQR
jgi:hypothetical protein